MNSKATHTFDNFMAVCEQTKAHPLVLFAKGTFGGSEALIMLAGPVLTLESLAQLRTDVLACIDEKEQVLKAAGGPTLLSVSTINKKP